MIIIKDVLVAMDFSPGSHAALAYGRALAHNFSAKLHVLHVLEDSYLPLMMSGGAVSNSSAVAIQQDLEASAHAAVDTLVGDDDRRELHAEVVLQRGASASQEIVKYAQRSGIDVVVMGTHGRGIMDRVLIGSVTENVIRTAPCPVLTVRNPELEVVRPDNSS